MPALSSYVRIRCISYWMQNICLLYQIFSTFFQLISKHGKELTVSVILYPFSEMQASGHPLQVQILHTYRVIVFCKAVAELMLEILPLVLYLFMR